MGVVADEKRGEEIEGEGKPKNPFVIWVEAEGFFLLRPYCAVFVVQELHPHIEPLALQGSL